MAPQFEACLAILNEYTHPYESGRLNGFMATYLVDQGDYKEAGIFLKKAEKLLAYSNFESNSLKFLRARLKLVGGEKEDAYSLVVSALNAWKKNSFDPWFLGIAPWMIQLLLIAYEENHLQDYIKNVFSTADHQPLKFLYDMQRELPENLQKQAGLIIQQIPRPKCAPLKVIGLGKFRVKVGDREIIPAEWKSKNAERLFKYLLLSHSKGYISNEILMELLWPEENPQITVKRLHVLLPTLRKMLEPDLKRGAPSAYIKRKGSGYQIVLGESGYFDVDQFIEEAGKVEKETASQKTLGHCLKAVSIYSGKLFPEEPYAEWCFDERERLQRLYLKLLQDIITIYEEMNLYSKCIEFAERYLDADLFCEEIYSRLMTYYAHINDTAKIRSTYERCIKYIVNELDCPISPETQEKYNTLLKVNSR